MRQPACPRCKPEKRQHCHGCADSYQPDLVQASSAGWRAAGRRATSRRPAACGPSCARRASTWTRLPIGQVRTAAASDAAQALAAPAHLAAARSILRRFNAKSGAETSSWPRQAAIGTCPPDFHSTAHPPTPLPAGINVCVESGDLDGAHRVTAAMRVPPPAPTSFSKSTALIHSRCSAVDL